MLTPWIHFLTDMLSVWGPFLIPFVVVCVFIVLWKEFVK